MMGLVVAFLATFHNSNTAKVKVVDGRYHLPFFLLLPLGCWSGDQQRHDNDSTPSELRNSLKLNFSIKSKLLRSLFGMEMRQGTTVIN